MADRVTVTLTPEEAAHVRAQLLDDVASDVPDEPAGELIDVGSPYRSVDGALEALRACAAALERAERICRMFPEPLAACSVVLDPDRAHRAVADLTQQGADMVAKFCRMGDGLDEDRYRWWLGYVNTGAAIRRQLVEQGFEVEPVGVR